MNHQIVTDLKDYFEETEGIHTLGYEFNFLSSKTTKCFRFALSKIKCASNLPGFKYLESFFIQRNFSYVTTFTLSHCRQDAHETNQNTDIQL